MGYLRKHWSIFIWALVFLLLLALLVGIQMDQKQQQKDEVLAELCPEGVLIYGADQSAPPLRFVDEDGVYKGVVVDLMNQLSLEMGVEIRTVPYLWEDALTALNTGESDICDMFMNEERKQQYAYTDPIYNLRTVLAIREEDDFTLTDVNQMRIATQKGDYANNYLRRNYPGAELVFVADVLQGMELLSQNQVDAVIGDEPVVYYAMGQTGGNNQVKLINTALYEEDVVLAVNKQKADLVPLLNSAISDIKRKGQLEKMQQKWFGISTPLLKSNAKKEILQSLSLPILAGIAVLFLFVINNRALKQQVRQRTAQLEESRNELRTIFDEMTEYIMVVDRDKRIVNGNQGLLLWLGRTGDSVTGRECAQVIKSFCGDCEACIIEACMETGGAASREVMAGSEVFEMAAHPFEKEHGVLVTFRNVSMEKIQRNQLLQSSKMMAIGQLAAGMAHEIRNPLGIIRTQSYLLRRGEDINERQKKSLDFIDANVNRASGIIDNVMNFWRVSEDKPESINLSQQLSSILELQKEIMKKRNIEAELLCDPDIQVCCSPESLKHILLNLSSNAVDAMEEGGRLRLRGVADPHWITMVCEDTGSGIAKENMDNLFNPFFTTKEPGKGTGLGLFIVYSEVQRLGGTISVDSEVGQGAHFTVIIPQGGNEKR